MKVKNTSQYVISMRVGLPLTTKVKRPGQNLHRYTYESQELDKEQVQLGVASFGTIVKGSQRENS